MQYVSRDGHGEVWERGLDQSDLATATAVRRRCNKEWGAETWEDLGPKALIFKSFTQLQLVIET